MTAHKYIVNKYTHPRRVQIRKGNTRHLQKMQYISCTAFKQQLHSFISMHAATDSVQPKKNNTFSGEVSIPSSSWMLRGLHSAEKCLFYFRSQLLRRLGVREWCSAETSMRRALNYSHGSLGKQRGCRWRFQVWNKFSCCGPIGRRVLCFFNVHFRLCAPMNRWVDLHASVLNLEI